MLSLPVKRLLEEKLIVVRLDVLLNEGVVDLLGELPKRQVDVALPPGELGRTWRVVAAKSCPTSLAVLQQRKHWNHRWTRLERHCFTPFSVYRKDS